MAQKIIHADDDKMTREFYQAVHHRTFPSYELVQFEDGKSLKESLEKLAGDGVALVLTDNSMPGMSGAEIIKEYAGDSRYSNTKFILFYGGDARIGKEAVLNGAFAFIEKPASMITEVVPLMKQALGIND